MSSKTVKSEASATKTAKKEEVTIKPVKKAEIINKPVKKEEITKSNAKNVAVIAPMKHEPQVEKKPEVKKVSRKRITAPPKSPEKKPAVAKQRQRITAPEPEEPSEAPRPIPVVTTKEECKYWPRCKRGDECLYLHIKAPKAHPAKPASIHSPATAMPPDKAKFKWTK